MYRFEEAMWRRGFRIIAGTDEAGRGPLAGPVVAACVVLPDYRLVRIAGINDSKLISEKKRENLFETIMKLTQVGLGIVSEDVIDRINIYQATRLAMKTAYENLSVRPDVLLIDGPVKLDVACERKNIVKGDRQSASIAAASIVAKVTRDRLMRDYHDVFPQYEFYRHKGYPTRRHRALLEKFGPSPIHRKTFGPVRELLESYVS